MLILWMDGDGDASERRETCVGCASAGLVRDAFWHEMREISDPEAQLRTQDSGDEKNAFFIVISTDIQL